MSARWSRPVSVRRINGEEPMTIEATEAERAALRETLDLVAIDLLRAELTLRPFKGEGVRVAGTVQASIVQECGVTLEPVPSTIDEPFVRRLHPDAVASTAIDVDPDAEDPPEPLEADTVDVGAIALEHFILAIDPYPRAEGAAFEDVINDADEEEPSPFAALAALKNRAD